MRTLITPHEKQNILLKKVFKYNLVRTNTKSLGELWGENIYATIDTIGYGINRGKVWAGGFEIGDLIKAGHVDAIYWGNAEIKQITTLKDLIKVLTKGEEIFEDSFPTKLNFEDIPFSKLLILMGNGGVVHIPGLKSFKKHDYVRDYFHKIKKASTS